ncbi:DNA helicase RecQ [bacterium]|nr:DNA helicase RecQ [bacterium]
MTQSPGSILRDTFGYASFRGLQEQVIEHVLGDQHALVVMPTGTGKSLCYQIPALSRGGSTVVVSPLIALMHDQVSALQQLGVSAAALNSTLTSAEQHQVEQSWLAGDIKLLYVAPERATSSGFLRRLGDTQVNLFAIDEAHCVSQWGHDFRPEYLQLTRLWETHPLVPRLALTATADGQTQREIVQRLQLEPGRTFLGGFDRPNIRYTIQLRQQERGQVQRFLAQQPEDVSGIIYCLSRRKVEEMAQWLSGQGYRALPYHAGLDNATRQKHQRMFQLNEANIMVATIAFGMGVDKPDVRFVMHLDLPKSVEAYYQETGRGGRDGLPAEAYMLYGLNDAVTLYQMMQQSQAAPEIKQVERLKLRSLLGLCETVRCRRQVLLEYFGDRCEPCGNCDTCLEPVASWDATTAAQKALSAVYRTGQRFGVGYLSLLLRGQLEPRMQSNGHANLPTFGVGKELSDKEWHSVFRQLVAHGYLEVNMEGHGGLQFTARSAAMLKGAEQLQLRRDTQAKAASAKALGPARVSTPLFERLREVRLRLSRDQSVPPYVIFHDSTLYEMAEKRPRTAAELRQISGVGESKLARYGDIFLQALGGDPGTPGDGQL